MPANISSNSPQIPSSSPSTQSAQSLDAFQRLAAQDGNVYQKDGGAVTSGTGWKGRMVEFFRSAHIFGGRVSSYDDRKDAQSSAATQNLFKALVQKYGLDTVRASLEEKKNDLSGAWDNTLKRLGIAETTPLGGQASGLSDVQSGGPTGSSRLTCADVRTLLSAVDGKVASAQNSLAEAASKPVAEQTSVTQRTLDASRTEFVNTGTVHAATSLAQLSPEGIRLQKVADETIAHINSKLPLGAPNKLSNQAHVRELGIDNRSLAMALDESSAMATANVSKRGFGLLSPAGKAQVVGEFVENQGAATCGLQAKSAYDHLVNELGERNVAVVTVSGKADHVFLVIGAEQVPDGWNSFSNIEDMKFAMGPDAMIVDPWAGKSIRLDDPTAASQLGAIFDEVVGHPDQGALYGGDLPDSYTVNVSDHLPEGQDPLPDAKRLESTLKGQAGGNTMENVPDVIKNRMRDDVLDSKGAVFYEAVNKTGSGRDSYPWLMSRSDMVQTPSFRAQAYHTIGHLTLQPEIKELLTQVGAQVHAGKQMVTVQNAGQASAEQSLIGQTRYDAENQVLYLGSGDGEALATALNDLAQAANVEARVTPEQVQTALDGMNAPYDPVARQQREHGLTSIPATAAQLAQSLGVEGQPGEAIGQILQGLGAYHESIGLAAEVDRIADVYRDVQQYLALNENAPQELYALQDALLERREAIARGLDGIPHSGLLPPKVSPPA